MTAKKSNTSVIPPVRIERQILLLRGQKVMLDFDLAELYGVEARALNQAVKRNLDRFPDDFMFQLTTRESTWITSLVERNSNSSQSVMSSRKHRGVKYRPYAFTEQGVAMLSSVLRSPRAVRVNIEIIRAFVRLRQLLNTHADLARKLARLEKKYDAQFKAVFEAIRELMAAPAPLTGGEMGFHTLLPRKAAKKSSRKSLS